MNAFRMPVGGVTYVHAVSSTNDDKIGYLDRVLMIWDLVALQYNVRVGFEIHFRASHELGAMRQ